MAKGCVAFILHAHLPYVRRPEYGDSLEERWLFEAISETYIPLLDVFMKLKEENINYALTVSITPTLLTMLSDPLLKAKYIKYLEKLIELSSKEIERTQDQPDFNRLARMYHEKYKNDLHLFKDVFKCDILSMFKTSQESGELEIIACTATHGFLPLMETVPESMIAQVNIGIKTYEKFFGKKPRGIWLPECGYIPSLEKILKAHDIEYFILESHGILFANPRPVFGTYAPIVTPNGLVAFGRDIESSKQVWSASEGYPGDYNYREFYRDIGYDLDFDYIKDYILPGGERCHTGIKYYRITGKTPDKLPYNPDNAKARAEMHAENFILNRERQVEFLSKEINIRPIIICPYDAELFGHWWYEGPYWMYSMFKQSSLRSEILEFTTLGRYLDNNPVMQVSTPCASSWGYKGYSEIWLNSSNEWIYRHLYKAALRMVELASKNRDTNGLKKDALNQAARELLLAQSSDWAFIMKAGTMADYAIHRTEEHLNRFTRLYHDIKENNIDEQWLKDVEYKDNIFPDIDYKIYSIGLISH